MALARILDPGSKLATARGLGRETLTSTLAEELDVEDADADELYWAMDWLLARQEGIERGLARRRLQDGSLVLCDVTSLYFEGRRCPLVKRGHSRVPVHARLLRRVAHAPRAGSHALRRPRSGDRRRGATVSVALARSSPAARAKASGRKRTSDGLPVHSFQTLLEDLGTLARNRVQPKGAAAVDVLTVPTLVQDRAFRLLGVKP